jgi:hypothetical protein
MPKIAPDGQVLASQSNPAHVGTIPYESKIQELVAYLRAWQ